MPPASVNTVSRASQAAAAVPASKIDANPNSFNLRDFVVDEDAANFTSALWQSIDQTAFVRAQTEALEAFNIAKALRLSQETAALEEQQRASAVAASTSASTSASASASASSSTRTTLEHKSGPSSSASDFAKQKSSSASSSVRERKQSVSASQQSSLPRLSLSTSPPSSFVEHTSRVSNSISASASSSASQSHASVSHRIEQRTLSKRELESPISKLSIPMAPSFSVSTSASASASSTSRTQTSDTNNTKRRRTERQTLTSPNTPSATQLYQQQQQQQQQQLVAPALVSKRSTGTPRDTRSVQPTTSKEVRASVPSTLVDPRSRHKSSATPSHALKAIRAAPEPRDTFVAIRDCTKCGAPVHSPRSQPAMDTIDIIPLLHVTCTKCQTTHCRGCFAPARCNRALVLASSRPLPSSASSSVCDGGSACTVRTCCPAVRAIAIFEALSWFDETYAVEVGYGPPSKRDDKGKGGESKERREAYVKVLISRAPSLSGQAELIGSMRRFEDAFVRTLKLICTWLQTPSRDDVAADSDDKSSNKMHASVPRLFMGSMLLEVIHVFLSNANIQDLVAHSEAYTASLELLRQMLDVSSSSSSSSWEDSITLATILRQPMRRIESSSGLRRAVWGDASVRYEDLGLSTTAGGRLVPNSTATVPINRRSLCDLVADLSTQQKHLLQLAEKATFPPTVEKVNALYDGIARVMIQNFLED